MALYLIVHPRWSDKEARDDGKAFRFANHWIDDDRLASIETTEAVVDACQDQYDDDANAWIYIYRTASHARGKKTKPTICCRALINYIDRENFAIYFKDQQPLNLDPSFRATQGMCYHRAPAPNAIKLAGAKNRESKPVKIRRKAG